MEIRMSETLLSHYAQPIEEYLKAEDVTEISVNDFDDVWIERLGKGYEKVAAQWDDREHLLNYQRMIARSLGQDISEDNPILDARLEDGTRINAVCAPIAVKGPSLSIRPYPKRTLGAKELIGFGSFTKEMKDYFKSAVEDHRSILIAGGTGSGKTTILRIVAGFIPHYERVISVEDTCEHLIPNRQNSLSFEAAKRKEKDGRMNVTLADLIVNSLRQRPDRIVVGEIREPNASTAFIDALNTGHEGCISTIHANSGRDSLERLAILYARNSSNLSMEICREIINVNIDMVIFAANTVDDNGARKRCVREVYDVKSDKYVYKYEPVTDKFISDL